MYQSSRDVYLPIEILRRELKPKLLLALFLTQNGHTVYVGQKGHVLNTALKHGKDAIYLNKSVGTTNSKEQLERLRSRNVVLMAQDEEHGATLQTYDAFFRNRKGMNELPFLDVFLCWGKNDFDFLKMHFGDFSGLRLTGSPRTSFWGESGKILLASEIKFLEKKYGDFVLITTNFVLANSPLGQRQLSRFRRQFATNPKKIDIQFESRLVIETELIKEYIEVINYLSNKGTKVVIRPHPTESRDLWVKISEGKENIIVDTTSEISALIHASRVVIHNHSTVGLEAIFSRKETIALTSEASMNFFSALVPNSMSSKAFSAKEVFDLISKMVSGPFFHPDSFLTDRFFGAGTLKPIEKIIEVISQYPKGSLEYDRGVKIGSRSQTLIKDSFLYRYLTLSKLGREKWEPVTSELVLSTLRSLAVSLNLTCEFEVQQVGPSTFRVR